MKTKIKNLPKKIYLQIGDIDANNGVDFDELTGVTWCADKINDNDIEYQLVEKIIKKEKKWY